MLTSAETSVWASMRQGAATTFGAAATALFTILLLSLKHVEGVPPFVVVLLVALIGLSAWRPGAALMVLAASVPIAAWTGRWWNGTVAWPETLVVAFAAGYCARSLWSRRERRDDLDLPISVFAALVIASLAVRLLVLYWTIGGAALWEQLSQLARADYFVASASFRDLDAAMRLIEGMVLLRAASSVAQSDEAFGPSLVRWFVTGAAAAAALNLWRVWQGALRLDEPVATFIRYLTTLRYNVHYLDVNAAGSYFVMALLVAVGVAIATRKVRWVAAAALIATSLALSGSRAALLAGAVSTVAWSAWRLRPRFRQPQARSLALALSSLLLLGCAAAVVYYVSARRNLTPSSTALEIRAEFARTTFRMIQMYPAFGVGIGQYVNRSRDFSSPMLVQTFRMPHENAHNNFLQILGELGVIGLAAFLWVLWERGRRALTGSVDWMFQGVMAALFAFLLTWLSGHPLLIDEPAMSFWLLLGTASGCIADVPSTVRSQRLPAAVAVIVIAAAAVSIPFRARRELATSDLEHQAIGLSGWQQGADGVRYRLGGAWSTVFVPADARSVVLPLRRALSGADIEVALWLDGRPADVVRVPADRWYELHLALPSTSTGHRFYRLELRAADPPSSEGVVLMIGKVEPR